ncbi:MAG: PAS domain S-box protein, partial [Prosthecobacter sp.]|nr:PAS domain S-box protein [Prosthecobacter sp.]
MITLAMAAIAWRFGERSIRGPLQQLSTLTEKVAAGDYSVRSGFDDKQNEVSRLGSALDSMISKLVAQRAVEDLHRKELQDSEEKYRLFFSANPVPMWVYDRKTLAFLDVNEAALKTYGYTRQEFLGKALPDIVAEEDHPLMKSRIDMPMFYDNLKMIRHRWHDGTLRNVIVARQEITYAGLEARLVYPQDVTEQLAAMRRLEEQQRLLAAILESTGEAIAACDQEGQLTFFNRAARQLHGRDTRTVASSALPEAYDLYRADGVTSMTAEDVPLLRALKGETLSRTEMVVAPRGKEPRTLLASASQVTDKEGHILGAVVAMHDITERKRIEKELRENEERLRLA